MPHIKYIVVGLLMSAGAVGSGWAWWRTLVTEGGPFWKRPRQAPLPSRTPRLFIAGGVLIIAKVFLIAWLYEILIEPAFGDQTGYNSERVVLIYQVISGVNVFVILIAAAVIAWRPAADRRSLGFRSENLNQQFRFGLHGFLLALLPVYLVMFVVLKLNLKQEPESVHELLRLVSDGYIFWPIVAGVLIAPIQEELVYRLLLQEGLVAAGYPIRLALPAVAVFFCINHSFPDMIPLVPLALLLGATYHYRNSFLANVVMHMVFNGFNITLTLLTGIT